MYQYENTNPIPIYIYIPIVEFALDFSIMMFICSFFITRRFFPSLAYLPPNNHPAARDAVAARWKVTTAVVFGIRGAVDYTAVRRNETISHAHLMGYNRGRDIELKMIEMD